MPELTPEVCDSAQAWVLPVGHRDPGQFPHGRTGVIFKGNPAEKPELLRARGTAGRLRPQEGPTGLFPARSGPPAHTRTRVLRLEFEF